MLYILQNEVQADIMYLDYRYYCSLGRQNDTTKQILDNWEAVLNTTAKYIA